MVAVKRAGRVLGCGRDIVGAWMYMSMAMDVAGVRMRMRVNDQSTRGIESSHSEPGEQMLQKVRRCRESQQNQDECDRELHRESKARGDAEFEKYNRSADGEHGCRMAETPYQADARGGAESALVTENRSNGNNMVRVGRVPHPEHQAKQRKAQRRGVTGKHRV